MFKVKYFCLYSFLLFLMLLILPNCNKSKEENQKVLPIDVKKIPSYHRAMKYKYNFGTIDTVGELSSETRYDSLGNEIELIHYTSGTIFRKFIYRYNSLQKLIETVEYNRSGNILQKILSLYDADGNIIDEIYKPGENLDYIDKIGIEDKIIKYYYRAGKLIRKIETIGGETKILEEIEYDSLGYKLKDYSLEDGIRRLSNEYIYDTEYNLKESVSYLYYGDLRKFVSKYDKSGNEIEMQYYKKDDRRNFYKHLIYNEDNFLIEQKAFNSLDEPEFIIKYIYAYY